MKKIVIINGPNLNLLGKREPEVYGTQSIKEIEVLLRNKFPSCELVFLQSNHEGALIDYLHEYGFDVDGIVLNAGAYTHTSIALADTIAGIAVPVVEVHLSNTAKREAFRKVSYIAPKCLGTICGLGWQSYALAIRYFLEG